MSDNLKHTPGPWFAVEYAGRYSFQRKDEYGDPDLLDQDSCSRAYYNTKLAAAAPELLEACLEFVRKVECGEARSKRSYAQMKEAIKKATE